MELSKLQKNVIKYQFRVNKQIKVMILFDQLKLHLQSTRVHN